MNIAKSIGIVLMVVEHASFSWSDFVGLIGYTLVGIVLPLFVY